MTTTEKPSRFSATPAEIDAFLREHFAEDVLLRYQWAIGDAAAHEAAEEIRAKANTHEIQHERGALVSVGMEEAADHIDPAKDGGHYPSALVAFRECTVPWHAHTDGSRLPTCRYDEPAGAEEQQ